MRLVVGLLVACLGVLAPVRVEVKLLPMAEPHALVGTWAPVCGSVAGELHGDVVLQRNDGGCSDACVHFPLKRC